MAILGVLDIIAAVGFLLLGLVALALGGVLAEAFAGMPGFWGMIFGAAAAVMGILFIVFGVLFLFVGIGQFKGQVWVWYVTVVFSALGVINNVIAFLDVAAADVVGLLIGLAINLLVLWYYFEPQVKAHFKVAHRAFWQKETAGPLAE